jgi:hypothetical protein
MAGSFVVLGMSGLNMLFGRYVLMPVIGKEAFAAVTLWGKYLHNYLSFAFMAGVALAFVLWVAHNLPSRHDLVWIMKGGGILFKGSHPAGQEVQLRPEGDLLVGDAADHLGLAVGHRADVPVRDGLHGEDLRLPEHVRL